MRRRLAWQLLIVGTLAIWYPSSVLGESMTLEPVQGIVLPPDSTGKHWAAFKFDLTQLMSESGGQVNEATLLWQLEEVSTDGIYAFSAHEIKVPWSSGSLFSPQDSVTFGPEADFWIVDERANEANNGVVIRLGLKEIVESWRTGNTPNYGIVVVTQDVGSAALAAGLAAARLKIWCSCSSPDSSQVDSTMIGGD